MLVQPFGQRAKERRCHREIEGPNNAVAVKRNQIGPASVAGGVDGYIMYRIKKALQALGIALFHAAKFCNRLADHLAVTSAVNIGPRGPNNATTDRHLPCHKTAEQARQDLAAGQIPGSTKDDKVEFIDGNDARYHGNSG